MGYAGVAGVAWVVLTDGNEYRLYNSHATVPIEEKLFRTVSIAIDPAKAGETLQLLSKKRMQENEIDVLWKAHFVDRQVQAAVGELFSATPDPSIVRLVTKKVPSLSPKDIRASLQRASISFDFPTKPEQVGKLDFATKKRAAKPGKNKAKQGQRALRELGVFKSQVVPLLIREGILLAEAEIQADYRGETLKATITADGQIEFRKAKYKSPSAAGAAAKQYVSGKFTATDGWSFWHYSDGNGAHVPLSVARQQYLAKQEKQR